MKYLTLLFATLFVLSGCGSYKATTQAEEYSYIQLKGNFMGTTMTIDEQAPIVIGKDTKTFKLNGEKVAKFYIARGTHTIQIHRQNTIVVNRKIFVSDGNTFEVIVP